MGVDEKRMYAIGSIASHLSDAVLCFRLDDGRLPLIIDQVDSEISLELAFVAEILDATFDVCAAAAGTLPWGFDRRPCLP